MLCLLSLLIVFVTFISLTYSLLSFRASRCSKSVMFSSEQVRKWQNCCSVKACRAFIENSGLSWGCWLWIFRILLGLGFGRAVGPNSEWAWQLWQCRHVSRGGIHCSCQLPESSRHCQGLLEGIVNWKWLGFMLMNLHLLSTLNVYKASGAERVWFYRGTWRF